MEFSKYSQENNQYLQQHELKDLEKGDKEEAQLEMELGAKFIVK
jgi:hypothetical protein